MQMQMFSEHANKANTVSGPQTIPFKLSVEANALSLLLSAFHQVWPIKALHPRMSRSKAESAVFVAQ